MAIVKPFKGLRTPNQVVCEELACLPYDVMNSEEAAQMAAGKPKSLLHVTRAEIDCPPGTDIHSETVYHKSVENFKMFQEKGGWYRIMKLNFIFMPKRWTDVLNTGSSVVLPVRII